MWPASSLPALAVLSLLLQSVKEKPFTLTAHAELVLLDVSVKETKGGYVSNLTKANFQIYENGKLQTISHFSSEDTPITVGLVIDDSRSMRPKRGNVVDSALAFIDASNPHDEMFNVNRRARSARLPAVQKRPFPRDQFPMPAQ